VVVLLVQQTPPGPAQNMEKAASSALARTIRPEGTVRCASPRRPNGSSAARGDRTLSRIFLWL